MRAAQHRPRLLRQAVLAGALALWAAASVAAPACGSDLSGAGRQQLDNQVVRVVFKPSVWPVPVGQHFGLKVAVCTPGGLPQRARLRVDADMPVHRHGMNYRTTVKSLGTGQFAVEGLMFHMPGRWRFIFDIDLEQADGAGGRAQAQRLTHEIDLD